MNYSIKRRRTHWLFAALLAMPVVFCGTVTMAYEGEERAAASSERFAQGTGSLNSGSGSPVSSGAGPQGSVPQEHWRPGFMPRQVHEEDPVVQAREGEVTIESADSAVPDSTNEANATVE